MSLQMGEINTLKSMNQPNTSQLHNDLRKPVFEIPEVGYELHSWRCQGDKLRLVSYAFMLMGTSWGKRESGEKSTRRLFFCAPRAKKLSCAFIAY